MYEFKDAKYVVTIDGTKQIVVKINGVESWVELDTANRHYAEMMEKVKEGTLTIKDTD